MQLKISRLLIGALATLSLASVPYVSEATGVIGKEDLAGPWLITLTGDTGCGISTTYATGTLNALGTGTFILKSHTSGCGNPSSTEKFTVQTLNANGSGTANLTCNNQNSCGWDFTIQVMPDRAGFVLVDVTNGGNYLQGFAVHQ